MEPPNTGFEPGLKGFLGDLNVSLSAPNDSELLALLPGPNMDHEVSNTVNDLRFLKGIHNDGGDLSLSLNDSNEREREPPLFPDLTNGFDFGFAQPILELGSGVSSGFHFGSSSMAHACVNDDSDFNMVHHRRKQVHLDQTSKNYASLCLPDSHLLQCQVSPLH